MIDLFGGITPIVALALMLVAQLTVTVLVVLVLRRGPRGPAAWLTAVIVIALATSGYLLLSPTTASTGAQCIYGVSVEVLGSAGSQAAVDDAEPGFDRVSTISCDARERTKLVGSVVLVVLAGGVAAAVHSRTRRTQLHRD